MSKLRNDLETKVFVDCRWCGGSSEEPKSSDAMVRHMVNRFLSWRLPEEFHPDGGISFEEWYNTHTDRPMRHAPIGTNLFSYAQAEAMVRHMIGGMAAAAPTTEAP